LTACPFCHDDTVWKYTNRRAVAVLSEVLDYFLSIFTEMFNTRISRLSPTTYQTLHTTATVAVVVVVVVVAVLIIG